MLFLFLIGKVKKRKEKKAAICKGKPFIVGSILAKKSLLIENVDYFEYTVMGLLFYGNCNENWVCFRYILKHNLTIEYTQDMFVKK